MLSEAQLMLIWECPNMMNRCLVTALTLGFLAFTFSILPVSPGNTEPSVVEKRAACVEKGRRWDPVNERCMLKMMGKKAKPPNAGSGGAGGGECHSGYTYDARSGGCVPLYQDLETIRRF
jgi:hypothetical protein